MQVQLQIIQICNKTITSTATEFRRSYPLIPTTHNKSGAFTQNPSLIPDTYDSNFIVVVAIHLACVRAYGKHVLLRLTGLRSHLTHRCLAP